MQWINVKDKIPDFEKEEGWYLVLINKIPKVCYYSYRHWERSWHIPDEWANPTHYIKIPSIEDFWSNKNSMATMD